MKILKYRDLETYQLAFNYQQKVFVLTKEFPREELYSLTDQWRRSSRSIGANMAEAWAKRKYISHFISKLTDADAELQESKHWRQTAFECGYLNKDQDDEIREEEELIGSKIGGMINNAESFCRK
jgi:four helix bundle protein